MSLRSRVRTAVRVLILSWEYPPIVEGGLARHVRKLSEALVREGVEVHVLTRGAARTALHEVRHGVHVHRVPEPAYPDDLNQFVAWVRRMNAHMLRAGAELVDELEPDLVHGHDWLAGRAGHPPPPPPPTPRPRPPPALRPGCAPPPRGGAGPPTGAGAKARRSGESPRGGPPSPAAPIA